MSKVRILALAATLIIPFEGLRQVAYRDPPGIPTICWGHTGPDVKPGQKWSMDQCKAALDKDMLIAYEIVKRCAPGAPDTVTAAFTSAVYNIGPTVACKSTAANFLAAANYRAACGQLPRWNKSRVAGVLVELPGLTKRRAREMEICVRDLQ